MRKRGRAFWWIWWACAFACLCALADDGALLENGSEALGARLALIRSAKHEILLSTFVLKCDEASAAIHRELLEAVKRGVKVSYLVDAFTLRQSSVKPMLRYLEANGVDVKVHNPIGINIFAYYFRQHDKLLIADGERMIIGGRNHWNESFALGPKAHLDLELWIEGQSAAAARDYFFERWKRSEATFPQTVSVYSEQVARAALAMASSLEHVRGFSTDAFERGLRGPAVRPLGDIEFIYDRRPIFRNRPNTIDALEALIRSAKKSILIETPWFVTTNRVRRALKDAKQRGVEIRVLTNSREASESWIRNLVSRVSSRHFFQKYDIPLYEFAGPASLHSKYVSVDGEAAYVGSYNFGPRSEHTNSETGVILRNPELVRSIDAVFEARLESARLSPPYHPVWDNGCLRWLTALLSTQY